MTSSRTELRKFGLLVGGIFAAWAGYTAWRRGIGLAVYAAGGGGAILLLLGAMAPRLLGPLYIVWMRLAGVLGWINTRVLLGLMFFLVVTPIAFIGRVFGRDALDRRKRQKGARDGPGASYWREHEDRADPERYKRQF
jgi:hypothetical protein